jgi:hypothetical protein
MDMAQRYQVSVHHTPPRQRTFPIDACPAARNTAIAKAQGELLVWIVDYSFLPPTCLAQHWGVWEKDGSMGSGAHRYRTPPLLAYSLPDYAPMRRFHPEPGALITYEYKEEDSRQFAADILEGFYDPYWWSVFREPVTTLERVLDLAHDPLFYMADPKLAGIPGGWVYPEAFHGKNEATPTVVAAELGGFDEAFDGHLYDDSDFGVRCGHTGRRWILLEKDATVEIVNPRHFFPHLVRLSGLQDHLERYQGRQNDPQAIVIRNPYDLAAIRGAGAAWYVD